MMFQKYFQRKIRVTCISGLFRDQLLFWSWTCSTLRSNTSRNIYVVSKPSTESHKKIHCFKNLYPWKTLSDFSNYLKSSIVYNQDGLCVLNKPYGVRVYQRKEKGNMIHGAVNFASQEDYPYSVEDCLLDLKNHLNVPDLVILKSAERYTSGIVLLASNKTAESRVKKSQARAKHENIPQYIYWAVANGSPLYPAMKQKVGIKLVDLSKGEKQPVIVTEYTKRDMLEKKVKPVIVEHRTIATDKETSTAILEIATSSVKWHFLRVYASSQASSILGDALYGPRRGNILGQPVNINPESILAYDVQPLPELLCQRLSIRHSVSGHLLVPTMLHFRTVILPKYSNNKDLIINAPAPQHFSWTCSRLGFVLPD